MVIQLRKDGLDSLSEAFICPCRWSPVLLVQPISVIVYVLRCTVAPRGSMLYVILSHLTPVGTGILADLYRLGVNAEISWR
jgi:hypothetical protein